MFSFTFRYRYFFSFYFSILLIFCFQIKILQLLVCTLIIFKTLFWILSTLFNLNILLKNKLHYLFLLFNGIFIRVFFFLFTFSRWIGDNEHKQVFAFISTYTKHDSIFSIHCIRTFMQNFFLPPQIRFLYFGSDGGSHFKNTYVFYFSYFLLTLF